MDLRIGKYQLVRRLAVGGMAEVWLAQAAGPGGFSKQLVLKRILPHLAEDRTFVDLFLSEARVAALLNHPNLVHIFDFGEADGTWFLAMEFIDGPNLRVLQDAVREGSEPLPCALAARVVASACEGLAHAHALTDPATGEPLNLVHRDISPDNLLVSRTGVVKVVDFGIAKAAGQAHKTKTGGVRGKVPYMSPEQLASKALDPRADVYALGVVLYELLAGALPYEGEGDAGLMKAILFDPPVPLAQRRADVPALLQEVVERALSRKREERFEDCTRMQEALERYLKTEEQPSGGAQLAQWVARWVPVQKLSSPAPTPAGQVTADGRGPAVAPAGTYKTPAGPGEAAVLPRTGEPAHVPCASCGAPLRSAQDFCMCQADVRLEAEAGSLELRSELFDLPAPAAAAPSRDPAPMHQSAHEPFDVSLDDDAPLTAAESEAPVPDEAPVPADEEEPLELGFDPRKERLVNEARAEAERAAEAYEEENPEAPPPAWKPPPRDLVADPLRKPGVRIRRQKRPLQWRWVFVGLLALLFAAYVAFRQLSPESLTELAIQVVRFKEWAGPYWESLKRFAVKGT